MSLSSTLLRCLLLSAAFIFPHAAMAKETLNIYSAQKAQLIKPLLETFEKETGIGFNLITGEDASLIERLAREGERTPADVLLAADVANLYRAQDKGLLQPVHSPVLDERIPEHLHSSEGYWYGFTTRSRVIFYNKEKVKPEQLSTYEDLADPKWKGQIMVRSSNNDYNQSLLASIIAHDGREKALEWAKGVVANFAAKPSGGDRDQLRAIAAGQGSVALANTYYYGLMLNAEEKEERDVAAKLGIFFPNQNDRGTHTNIRGGGVTAHTKHKEAAQKLLDFLAGDEAQQFFSQHNYEYPVVKDVPWPEILKGWGDFKRDTLPLTTVGKLNAEAIKVFDEAGWP